MRRVRGGRNKDLGLFVNTAVIVKVDWITYLLFFLCALFGTLLGVLIGKIAGTIIILLGVIFLGLTTAGLITAWSINQKNRLMETFVLQESMKEQYNAFCALIGELEYNLSVEQGAQAHTDIWQDLQFKYSYFPAHVYDDLCHIYSRFSELEEFDIVEYRQVIFEELNLPDLISVLKDWQQKIKRQLPYLD
ncbi:MAG: hypothetical protein VR72_17520 [Clostridiaceae bacterium BRH_c20a]|nr:MAG: hypothetical protein VR72_17520 [Clostridiaceae bacterium BRH_c20a]